MKHATFAALLALVISASSGLIYRGPDDYALVPFFALQGLAISVSSLAILIAPKKGVTRFRLARLLVIVFAAVWMVLLTVGPFTWGVI